MENPRVSAEQAVEAEGASCVWLRWTASQLGSSGSLPGPEAASRLPLCLCWSPGCPMGAGVARDPLALVLHSLQGQPSAAWSCRVTG